MRRGTRALVCCAVCCAAAYVGYCLGRANASPPPPLRVIPGGAVRQNLTGRQDLTAPGVMRKGFNLRRTDITPDACVRPADASICRGPGI